MPEQLPNVPSIGPKPVCKDTVHQQYQGWFGEWCEWGSLMPVIEVDLQVGQLLSVISAASTCLPGIVVPLASTKPISERLCTAVQQTVDGWIAWDLRNENMVTSKCAGSLYC